MINDVYNNEKFTDFFHKVAVNSFFSKSEQKLIK